MFPGEIHFDMLEISHRGFTNRVTTSSTPVGNSGGLRGLAECRDILYGNT
jgi:hypothetical protein